MDESRQVRLQVFLSRSGIASRRNCEKLIAEGRVKVNGSVVLEMGIKVDPESDSIEFDEKQVKTEERKQYIALNKPKNYLCANSDPFNRPLALDLFRNKISERLFHVGRLDFSSKGLIFFSNDGFFASAVSHPSNGFEKEYCVETGNPVTDSMLKQFRSGIIIENVAYRCKDFSIINPRKILLTLIEGKNREIRRVFEYFGIVIKELTRIRLGRVTLQGIREGSYRHLSREEIDYFFKKNT